MPSKCLLEDRVEIWQRAAILESRKAMSADDRVEFRLSLLLNFGKGGHGKEERIESARRL